MAVRWEPEHCAVAEHVSAYVDLSSCVTLSRPEKAWVRYVRAQIHQGHVRWDVGYIPKGSLRSAYEHYVGTKLASLGDAEGYLRLRRRYYLAEPSVGTLGNKAAKLTRGDATDAR